MTKAFVCITDIQPDEDGIPKLIYRVVISDEKVNRNYGCDHRLDVTLSLDETMEAIKEKILNDAVYRGYSLSKGDVIPFGAPVAKDTASFTDKTKGITSDRSAVVVNPKKDSKPTLMARATEAFKGAFDWMMS